MTKITIWVQARVTELWHRHALFNEGLSAFLNRVAIERYTKASKAKKRRVRKHAN